MNSMLKLFAILLLATLFLNGAMVYMADNISDFENVALPPKKVKKFKTPYPILKVDAQSRDRWTLVDFSTGKTHSIEDPDNEKEKLKKLDWDLGFQRTKVISNGGETNPEGPVEILDLGPRDFNSIQEVPEAPYKKDARAWGAVTNKSIVDWYLYRTRTHNVESKRNLYIVRTRDGHIKMRIINYYCGQTEKACKSMMCTREEAACITIEYQHLPQGLTTFPILPAPSKQTAQVTP